MGMTAPGGGRHRRGKRLMAEMNVVPYIDVMLVLLIIFMVTAPLVTQGVKVDLPQTSSEVVPPSDKEPAVISIDADGRYFLNYGDNKDKPIDLDTLATRLAAVQKYSPGLPILVRGDRNVPYGKVVELMGELSVAGIDGVGLITEPPPK
jgi:biopolymer transport protein TolR